MGGAVVVDSIIAELIMRTENYERGAAKVIKLHRDIIASAGEVSLGQKRYDDIHSRSSDKAANDEEQLTRKIGRTRRERVDVVKTAAKAEIDTDKAAAAERVRIAESAENRLAAIAARAAARANAGVTAGSGRNLGATVPRMGGSQAGFIDAGEVAAAKELDLLALDIFDKRQRAAVAGGENLAILKQEISELQRAAFYRRQGLSDEQAAVRANAEELAIAKLKAEQTGRPGQSRLRQALGAAAFGYSPTAAAVGGLVAAGSIAIGAKVIADAAEYGRQIQETSKQLGLSSTQLQVYQYAAKAAGASQEELSSALGQFQEHLGRARTGSAEEVKVFNALGISVKNFATAGDALPTVIDRLSKIPDPAKRAAVGYRLFGEEYRKLDPLLSGGNKNIADLTGRLQAMGLVLSDGKISKLNDVSKGLAEVNRGLSLELDDVVSKNATAILSLAHALGELTGKVISFLGAHPDVALAIVGGLAGGAIGGAPGAVIGAAGGVLVGASVKRSMAENNMDLAFRRQAVRDAQQQYLAAKSTSQSELDIEAERGGGGARNADQETKAAEENLRHQTALLRAATAAKRAEQRPAKVAPGSPDDAKIDALGRQNGKSAMTLANEADQRTLRFNEAMGRYQNELEDALAQQTQDAEERNEFARRQLQRDLAREIEDLKLRAGEDIRNGAEKGIIESQLAQRIAAAKKAEAEKENVLNLQNTVAHLKDANDAAQRSLDFQDDLLRSQLAIATTADERRKIEQKLLDNARKHETLDANTVIARAEQGDSTVSNIDLARAKDVLRTQDARDAAAAAENRKRNQGPGEAYLDRLPTTAKKLDEAFQGAAVNGLQNFNDKLSTSIDRMLHLHGLAGQFLSDLIKIGLEREVIAPIADALFGKASGGSGGGGGGLGSLFSLGASVFGGGSAGGGSSADAFLSSALAGGRAGGGDVVGGRTYLVGENGPEPVTFGQSGKVYPTGKLRDVTGGGGGTSVYNRFSIDLRGARTDEQTMAEIKAYVDSQDQRWAGQADINARRGLPSASIRYGKLGTSG